MPMLDMPLEKLRLYEGTNPKPARHDQYWETALKELDSVDPQIELKPATFQTRSAECFDLYFTGVGGVRVYAKYIRPRNRTGKVPAVLDFHGYTGSSGNWNDKLAYVAEGFALAALDCRGQGGLSDDTAPARGRTHGGMITRGLSDSPEKLYFRNVFLDVAQLARIVIGMDEVDENRVAAKGGSQGGALALVCGALEPRIRKVAATFPFLCDYKRIVEMDLAEHAYDDLRTYFRQFDPTHEREDEIYEWLGYIDVQHLAPRIRGEVLMGTGLMDNICPPSTQFAAYNKITSEKKMIVYPEFGHEHLVGWEDHVYQFITSI